MPSLKYIIEKWEEEQEILLQNILDKKCVLIVGPNFYVVPKKNAAPLEKQLASFLKKQEEKLGIRVYDDGWFHYTSEAEELDTYEQVKKFFEKPNVKLNSLLEKLVQIPFHIIINLTPDNRICQSMDKLSIPHSFSSYKRSQAYKSEGKFVFPSIKKPIVYNVMGELSDRNSLVMTYDDFYSYLESVFNGKSMPPKLKELILETDYYLFLGMPFDKWYMHLFMRVLKQHVNKEKKKKYSLNFQLDDRKTLDCYEQYRLYFVSSQIDKFVESLFSYCQDSGSLRMDISNNNRDINLKHLKNLVSENEFEDLFDTIERTLGEDEEEFVNEMFILKGEFNTYKKSSLQGVSTNEELDKKLNRLRKNCLEFLDSVFNTS